MRRWVVVGPGGIGGSVAGMLALGGRPMAVVARPGSHHEAALRRGLTVQTPAGSHEVYVEVLSYEQLLPSDIILLAVKSQHTAEACAELPGGSTVISLQNGLLNGAEIAKVARHVGLGMVFVPAVHLEPGVVALHGTPHFGRIDLGWQGAEDPGVLEQLAKELTAAGFPSAVHADVLPILGAKFLTNIGGVVQALGGWNQEVVDAAQAEAVAALDAAGIPYEPLEAFLAGVSDLGLADVEGMARPGGSTWQSLARGISLETDHLNGHVVRLAELHGLEAPVNAKLLRLAQLAQQRMSAPGTIDLGPVLRASRGS